MNLDINELLNPISDDVPCGINLRADNDFSSRYYQLKNARAQARTAERQRMQQSETELVAVSDWQPIAQLASELLMQQSKDLEIAAWLVEAWVRLEGWLGLTAGLTLLGGLAEQFGAALAHDEADGIELQLASVQGLSGEKQPGTLLMPLMSLAITQTADEANFAGWQYQQALELAYQTEAKRSQRIAQGATELSEIQQAARNTELSFGVQLQEQVAQAQAALTTCEAQFQAQYGEQAPSWHYLRQTVETLQSAVQSLYTAATSAAENPEQGKENAPAASTRNTAITTREPALMAIEQAANYFIQYEPHSPIAYALQQALRWAELSLPELMQEILANSQGYLAYCRITGVPMAKQRYSESDHSERDDDREDDES